jgi:hypothetical protein
MPVGTFRRVVLVDRLAFKLPRFKNFSRGMRSNRWERELWRVWRRKFGWENLCPVLFADPIGLIVVMPRAIPVSRDDVLAADPDYYPTPTEEYSKPEDYGRLNGAVVILDYGLPDTDLVDDRRAYYAVTERR